jgi:peptidoglycan/LPS O-acetylase OafA/YrhL
VKQTETASKVDKLDALTSMRFFAALLVFSWHCVPMHRVAATFSLGYAGVGFFFLLSGFILTYSYRAAFAHELRTDAVRAFYVARVARIVPLHLVAMPPLILTMVFFGNRLWSGVGVHTQVTEVAAQAVLLQSWFPADAVHFGGNGPSWSISVEAFFYALFPILAFALLRAFRAAPAYAALGAAFAVWLLEVAVLTPQHATIDDWRFYVFPPARLADFVVGMLVGIAVLRGDAAGRWRLRGTSMEMLAVTAVGLSVIFSPLAPLALRFSAVLMPAWAFTIYVFAARRGALSRALQHPILVRLGEVSFAFYLIHLAVIVCVTQWLGTNHPLFVTVAFGVTLGLSFVLFHGVEQPMRRRIRRAFDGARGRSAQRRGRERAATVTVSAVEQRGFHVQPREAV